MTEPTDPPTNAFNSHEPPPPHTQELEIPEQSPGSPHEQAEDVPNAHPSQTRKAFKQLYIILVAIGAIIGIFAAIGVVKLLGEWGLTDPPVRVEERQNEVP